MGSYMAVFRKWLRRAAFASGTIIGIFFISAAGINMWLGGRPSEARIVDGRCQVTLTYSDREPWTIDVSPLTYRAVKIIHFGWPIPYSICFLILFTAIVVSKQWPELDATALE
jgi:hypothetical protein